MPDTKVTHHEPPTCPAFLSLLQAYADLRTLQLNPQSPTRTLVIEDAIRRIEGQAA